MKPTLAHPSWSQIDKACAVLAGQIMRLSHFRDTKEAAIVGLARGGLVPAVIMSHILGIKLFPISYSSKAGNGEYKEYENTLPEIPFRTLLIVDDIVDTGHTFKEVVGHYQSLKNEDGITKHDVFSAALYYKQGSVFRPNYAWQDIPYDAPWIIFPWEL